MTIFAAENAASTCPAWCQGHIPSHISAEQLVVATSGPERHDVYVSLEQEDEPGSVPAVRIEGAANTPMTPAQAVQLGMLLIARGAEALTGGAR